MKYLLRVTTKKILICVLVLSFTNTFSQTTKYIGYFYTGVNNSLPLKYTREYKLQGGNYVTLYKIISPTEGYYLNITATHYKKEKKIVVDIDDITVKIGGHVSTQEITYEEPSLKHFGRQGSFKQTFDAQNVLPNELELKFVDSKYEYIKVVTIARDDQMNYNKWYILDEKN